MKIFFISNKSINPFLEQIITRQNEFDLCHESNIDNSQIYFINQQTNSEIEKEIEIQSINTKDIKVTKECIIIK